MKVFSGLKLARLATICLAMAGASAPGVAQDTPGFTTAAKQAILLDSRSGTVYFQKNADVLMAPASMSKIMTMLLVFEDLKAGRLRLDDEFTITPDAWRRGGAPSGSSTMYAKVNSRVRLEDLIKGVIIQSANDAAIAIAEGISGSEQAFAQRMTKRAHELGMSKSTFKNATGLPAEGHMVTASELAQLSRYLVEVFPEFYKIYSTPEFTWNNIRQRNRNPLLGKYPGADGIKTGHTKQAGYGLVGSAKRDGRRLILVLNGMRSKGERAREAIKLMDWGFRRFKRIGLYDKGEKVADARVWGGNKNHVDLVAENEISIRLSDAEKSNTKMELVFQGPLKAPIRAGEKIGKVIFRLDGKVLSTAPVVAGEGIQTDANMWGRAYDSLMYMAFGG